MSVDGDSGLIDSSVVVRYLTDDPLDMAERAAGLIDGGGAVVLSELALVESAYVLESYYGVARPALVDGLAALVRRRNLRMLQLPKATVLEALELCRSSRRVSFTDALLWAQASHSGIRRIFTFDRRFPRGGIELPEI